MTNLIVGSILEEIQERALKGEVYSRYIKAVRSKVAVYTIDPFTGRETILVLKGDIERDKDVENAVVSLYTNYDVKFFERRNRKMIESGVLVPYNPEMEEMMRINAITDEKLREALDKKFFAIKALLDKFTSPVPVERTLRMAEDMNKTIGTINAIKARLSTLQQNEYAD